MTVSNLMPRLRRVAESHPFGETWVLSVFIGHLIIQAETDDDIHAALDRALVFADGWLTGRGE